jgi:hypothetical protein
MPLHCTGGEGKGKAATERTTPASVTRPFSAMMWTGGFACTAYGRNSESR